MRIIALDYGSKTVGVAISDETKTIATPLEVITREDEKSIKKTVKRIGEIIKEYDVEKIVLGYPKNMDNTISKRCQITEEFAQRLKRNFKKMPIELYDERLSTIGGKRSLTEANMTYKKKTEVIDKMAAAFILQGYLERIKIDE